MAESKNGKDNESTQPATNSTAPSTPDDAKNSDTKPKKSKVAAISVRAFDSRGFRRGGRSFTQEPTVISVADLSKDELAAIRSEPRLAVQDVEVEA